jgi:hypothetical protein
MRQEEPRTDLPPKALQVRIGPGWQDVTIEPRFRPRAISSDAEATPVGRRLGLQCVMALRDQRMAGRGNDVLEKDFIA